jgi:acetyltransferase-like isoleucine patch superfamily enzyme
MVNDGKVDLRLSYHFLFLIYRALVSLAAALYQAEGINIPLKIMPTRLIAPTLQRYGAQIGNDVRFQAPLTIHNAAIKPEPFYHHLTVGSHCFLGRELFLDLQDKIIMEDYVTISHRVMILTHTDVGQSPLKEGPFPPSQASVTIGAGAYIGAGTIILPGVRIGHRAAVGAGAVVTRDVASGTVVAGVPARLIRKLDL